MLAKIFMAAPLFLLMACEAGRYDDRCQLAGDNYLLDKDFTLEAADKRSRHWFGLQHGGEKSFTTSMAGGELTINKIGTQPWYLFRQRLQNTDLAGKKMALRAELKLDLRAPASLHGFKVGGGLYLLARSDRGKIALRSIFNHEPHLGTLDWHEVQVIVQLPADTTTVEVGFLHQADGTLQVRKPAFHQVEGSPDACAVTPDLELELEA